MMYLTWHTDTESPNLLTLKLSYRTTELVAKDFKETLIMGDL